MTAVEWARGVTVRFAEHYPCKSYHTDVVAVGIDISSNLRSIIPELKLTIGVRAQAHVADVVT
jgi:hypothetical protein